MQGKDYVDISELDCDIPEDLREKYNKCMQSIQNEIRSILYANGD